MITFRRTKRIFFITALLVMTMLLCTGCNEREKEQAKFRQQGITLMQNGDYEKALEAFQSALDLSLGEVGEEEMDICFYKAQTLYLMGDTEGAMDTYTAIINFNGDARAYFLRGNLYYSLDQEENALKDYAAALEKEDEDYNLYIGVYEALSAHGKEKEGQDYLNQALEIEKNTAYDKMQKGRINFLLGEKETAVSLLQQAIKGKEYAAYYYLAEIYQATGEIAAAEENIKLYIESDDADSYNLYSAGKTMLECGNYEMAIKCLEAALKLEQIPNKQIVMKTLVIAYEHNEDFEAAKTLMAEYVKAFPDDEEAAREFTFLETR